MYLEGGYLYLRLYGGDSTPTFFLPFYQEILQNVQRATFSVYTRMVGPPWYLNMYKATWNSDSRS